MQSHTWSEGKKMKTLLTKWIVTSSMLNPYLSKIGWKTSFAVRFGFALTPMDLLFGRSRRKRTLFSMTISFDPNTLMSSSKSNGCGMETENWNKRKWKVQLKRKENNKSKENGFWGRITLSTKYLLQKFRNTYYRPTQHHQNVVWKLLSNTSTYQYLC